MMSEQHGEPVWKHLESLVQRLVDSGNTVVHGGFRPTQGGWECGLAEPLDDVVAQEAAAANERLDYDARRDELTCRHCWTLIAGGGALERSGREWFVERGYELELELETDSATVWASLVSTSNPGFRVPRYGRGRTSREAVESAVERWRVEQVGNDETQSRRNPLP